MQRFLMIALMFALGNPTILHGQSGTPPIGWRQILNAPKVYARLDSVTRIGENDYRVVTLTRDPIGNERIEWIEVRCADHSNRSIRSSLQGPHVALGSNGRRVRTTETPSEPFDKPKPERGNEDVQMIAICAFAAAR